MKKADEGNTVVILNKNDFISKLNHILDQCFNIQGSMWRKSKP